MSDLELKKDSLRLKYIDEILDAGFFKDLPKEQFLDTESIKSEKVR